MGHLGTAIFAPLVAPLEFSKLECKFSVISVKLKYS